jgi:hypothetical protein
MFEDVIKEKFIQGGKRLFKKKPAPTTAIGYRRGEIGSYSGEGSPIAWKALNYEYLELDNDHLLKDVAKFLGISASSWREVIGKFRSRYGDRKGIWLTKTKRDSDLYRAYGSLTEVKYHTANVVVNLGPDGIYVLLGEDISTPKEEDLESGDKPILEDVDQQPVRASREGKPKRNYSFYPTGIGAIKE